MDPGSLEPHYTLGNASTPGPGLEGPQQKAVGGHVALTSTSSTPTQTQSPAGRAAVLGRGCPLPTAMSRRKALPLGTLVLLEGESGFLTAKPHGGALHPTVLGDQCLC